VRDIVAAKTIPLSVTIRLAAMTTRLFFNAASEGPLRDLRKLANQPGQCEHQYRDNIFSEICWRAMANLVSINSADTAAGGNELPRTHP